MDSKYAVFFSILLSRSNYISKVHFSSLAVSKMNCLVKIHEAGKHMPPILSTLGSPTYIIAKLITKDYKNYQNMQNSIYVRNLLELL